MTRAVEKESFQTAVFQSMAEGVISVSKTGIITTANASAEKIFGCCQGELIGRHIAQLMPEEVREKHRGYLKDDSIILHRKDIMEKVLALEGIRSDGERFPIEVREDGVYVGLEPAQTHIRTVGDLMMESLANWGIRHVFGMVGHSNLGVADALRILEEEGQISYYGIRHEGAASFACSAYGKLTGRPIACLAIAGPGATNLLTGLWDAHVDRAPAELSKTHLKRRSGTQ